jgi:hypothetical protein
MMGDIIRVTWFWFVALLGFFGIKKDDHYLVLGSVTDFC